MGDFFFVHQKNPNDSIGGGGCLATGRAAGEDCDGRWINFFRVSTEFDASPHSVICEKHLREVLDKLEYEEELTDGDVLPIRDTKRVSVEARAPANEARPHVKLAG